MNSSIIEINVKQFITNLVTIRNHIESLNNTSSLKICLPVKSNAYGHGLVKMALIAENYVDYFAVSCLNEGIALREAKVAKPIVVFGAFDIPQIPGLINAELEITISSLLKAKALEEYCEVNNLTCRVHIKVDTGLNRVGVRPETSETLIDYVLNSKYLELIGVYSHFVYSDKAHDKFTKLQIEIFKSVCIYIKAKNPQVLCYIANSIGVCYYPESYLDMVKPGLLAYGYPAQEEILLPPTLATIKPILSLKSKVVYFKVVEAGKGISYNHSYVIPLQTKVVTIAIGYGDGYRRALSNKGEVLIRGKKYKISGNICMDMLMVDIGPKGEAYVGEEVVLIGVQGEHEISLFSIAAKCDTIIYEILCGFSERIPRIYKY